TRLTTTRKSSCTNLLVQIGSTQTKKPPPGCRLTGAYAASHSARHFPCSRWRVLPMRKPAPLFREFAGWWYVTLRVNGRRKQIKLAEGKENRAAAFDEYFRLIDSKAALAGHSAPVSSISVLAVLDKFLDYCVHECSAETTRIYRHFLESFAR